MPSKGTRLKKLARVYAQWGVAMTPEQAKEEQYRRFRYQRRQKNAGAMRWKARLASAWVDTPPLTHLPPAPTDFGFGWYFGSRT